MRGDVKSLVAKMADAFRKNDLHMKEDNDALETKNRGIQEGRNRKKESSLRSKGL